ncbi:MAG: MFS transporter [Pseudomonadota bacterium]
MSEASPTPTPAQPLSIPVLYIGVVALLIAGLQPVILGGLAEEGRITVGEIGLAATGELLALGVACGLAAAFLKPTSLHLKLIIACLVHAALNIATLWVSDGALIGVRTLTGLAAGVMLWSTVGMISRSARPEWQAAVFATVQTVAQLALAWLLPLAVIPSFGVDGGLLALAAISITAAVAVLGAPKSYPLLPKAEKGRGAISPLAWTGLGAVFLHMAFIVAIWVYLEPLAGAIGLEPRVAHTAVAATLAMQLLGGLAATFFGEKLKVGPVLIGVGLLNLGLLALLWQAHDALLFIGLFAVYGFLWVFVMPFHTVLLIKIDPTRRAAMQLGAAQLLGSSAGPLAASLIVGDTNAPGAMTLAAGCLVAALALFIGIVVVLSRRGVVTAPAA